MPIAVACDACKSKFNAKDELAGRAVRCPKCKNCINVPGDTVPGVAAEGIKTNGTASSANGANSETTTQTKPNSVASPTATATVHSSPKQPTPEQIRGEVLEGLAGEIDRVKTPLSYRFGILLAAFVMVLLPILYIALIVLTGFLVLYHMSHNAGMLEMGRGRGKIFVVLVLSLIHI